MKAILEFNLDDPDDVKAHKRCVKAKDMAIVLFEIYFNSHRYVEDVEQYRNKIINLFEDLDIQIDKLID